MLNHRSLTATLAWGLALGDHQSLLSSERDATLHQPSLAVTGLSLPDARWALSLATLTSSPVIDYTGGCSPSSGGPGTTPDCWFIFNLHQPTAAGAWECLLDPANTPGQLHLD
jgi:hypothetical protein